MARASNPTLSMRSGVVEYCCTYRDGSAAASATRGAVAASVRPEARTTAILSASPKAAARSVSPVPLSGTVAWYVGSVPAAAASCEGAHAVSHAAAAASTARARRRARAGAVT